MTLFDNPKQSALIALVLGFVGGVLIAVGIGIESVPVLVIGAVVLAASGATWAIRGVKEDQEKEA